MESGADTTHQHHCSHEGQNHIHCWDFDCSAGVNVVLALGGGLPLAKGLILELDRGKAPRKGLVLSHEGIEAALQLVNVVPRLLP